MRIHTTDPLTFHDIPFIIDTRLLVSACFMTRHGPTFALSHGVRTDRQDFMVSPSQFKLDFYKCLVNQHEPTFAMLHSDSLFTPYSLSTFHGIALTN